MGIRNKLGKKEILPQTGENTNGFVDCRTAYYREGSLENRLKALFLAAAAYYREGSLENDPVDVGIFPDAYYREGSLEIHS